MVDNGTNKRPRYFDGQYLQDTDFSDEQRYHRDQQRRHSRLLQVAGIAEGLAWIAPEVRPSETSASGLTVTVSAGTAIDAQGRQVVLLSDRANIPLLDTADGAQVLYIQYAEQESKQDLQDGTATRIEEVPELGFVKSDELKVGEQIAIAQITIADGKITQLNLDIRQYSGLRLPSSDNAQAPILRASNRNNAPKLATLTGDLSVSGAIHAGNSDIYFTNTEHSHSSVGDKTGYAAIENSSDYDALMILGRAGTDKGRKVRLWNYLQVEGSLDVTGNVGIGAANPTSKLEVNGDIRTNVALISDNPHGASYAAFSHKDRGTAGGYALLQQDNGETYLNAPTGRNIRFRINNTDKMIVTSAGKVGIRTTNPTIDLAIGDTDTGLQQQGDGQLAIYTDSTEKLRVNKAGNVGIGITSPTSKLEVNGDIKTNVALISDNPHGASYAAFSHKNQGTAGGYALLQQNNGETYLNAPTGRNVRFRINNSDKMIVTSAGKVGIGTTAPAEALAVNGNIDVQALKVGSYNLASHISADGAIYRKGGQVYIGVDDNLYIRDTNVSNSVDNIKFHFNTDDGSLSLKNGGNTAKLSTNVNAFRIRLNTSHHNKSVRTAYWNGDSNWDFSSDICLKKDIEKEQNILERLMQLDVKNYRWKDEDEYEAPKQIGMVAQDIQPLFPALVGRVSASNGQDESTLTLKYGCFGVLAIGGLKELKLEKDREISRLKEEVDELRATLVKIKNR